MTEQNQTTGPSLRSCACNCLSGLPSRLLRNATRCVPVLTLARHGWANHFSTAQDAAGAAWLRRCASRVHLGHACARPGTQARRPPPQQVDPKINRHVDYGGVKHRPMFGNNLLIQTRVCKESCDLGH